MQFSEGKRLLPVSSPLDGLYVYKGKTNFDPYLTVYTKVNSQWSTDLTVKGKTIKCLEKNLGEYFHDLRGSQRFLKVGTEGTNH